MSTEDEEPVDSLSDVEASIRFSPEYVVLGAEELRLYSASPVLNAIANSPEIEIQSSIKVTRQELEFAVKRNDLFKSIYRNEGVKSDSEDDFLETSTPKSVYVRKSQRQQKIVKYEEERHDDDDSEEECYSPGSDDYYDPELEKENSKENNKIPKILLKSPGSDNIYDLESEDENKKDEEKFPNVLLNSFKSLSSSKNTDNFQILFPFNTNTPSSSHGLKEKEIYADDMKVYQKSEEGKPKSERSETKSTCDRKKTNKPMTNEKSNEKESTSTSLRQDKQTNVIVTRSIALKTQLTKKKNRKKRTGKKTFTPKSKKNHTNPRKSKEKKSLKLKSPERLRKKIAEEQHTEHTELEKEKESLLQIIDAGKENKRVTRQKKVENDSAQKETVCASLPQTNKKTKDSRAKKGNPRMQIKKNTKFEDDEDRCVPPQIRKVLKEIQDVPCKFKIPEIQKNRDFNKKCNPPQTENNSEENDGCLLLKTKRGLKSTQINKCKTPQAPSNKEDKNLVSLSTENNGKENETLCVSPEIRKDLTERQNIICETLPAQKDIENTKKCDPPQMVISSKENEKACDLLQIKKDLKTKQNTTLCEMPEASNDREEPKKCEPSPAQTENVEKQNQDRCFLPEIEKDLKERLKITIRETTKTQNDREIKEKVDPPKTEYTNKQNKYGCFLPKMQNNLKEKHSVIALTINKTPEIQNDTENKEIDFVSQPRQFDDGPERDGGNRTKDIAMQKENENLSEYEDNFEVTDMELEQTNFKNSIIDGGNKSIQLSESANTKNDEKKTEDIYEFLDDSKENVKNNEQSFDAMAIDKDHEIRGKGKIIEKIMILEDIQIIKPTNDGITWKENSENRIDISEEDRGKSDDKEEIDNEPSIIVSKTNNDGFVRKWDRKQSCLYCNKEIAKLPRHLETKHKNEKEVALLMSHEKNSEQRKILLEGLRKKGNYLHNTRVLKSGKGMIIPLKRQSSPIMHTNLLPCPSCYGFYSRKKLSRHYQSCTFHQKSKAKSVQKQGAGLLPIAEGATQALRDKVLSRMANDGVTLVAKHDPLILKFGSKMWMKHEHDEHLVPYVSQKMRELARFVMEARKMAPAIVTLHDCIMPENFHHVLDAVKIVAKYDTETGRYATPSLALKLGHSLKKCAKIIETESLMRNVSPSMAQNFIFLCENEWSSNISRGALTTLYRNKWNLPDRLPLAEDVKKLNDYLYTEREKYVQLLKNAEITLNNWMNLAKVALAQTLLFNRRRSGEVERMPVETYEKRSSKQNDASIMETLTEFEKAISTSFVRFEIRGKKGRKVPVLLYPKLIEVYELLLLYRYHVGIPVENNFFFAIPPLSHLKGTTVLRSFAQNSDAAVPENLTSTRLRKNVATMSQVLNLSNNELDQLATFMGHDIRVHREYYRLPESTTQLAKISKILLASEKGKLHLFKGKTLDEIEIDPNKHSENEESSNSGTDEDENFNDSEVFFDNDHHVGDNDNDVIALEVERYVQEDKNSKSTSSEDEKKTTKKKGTCKTNKTTLQTKKNQKRKVTPKRKVSQKRPWPNEEKRCVEEFFARAIVLGKTPGKNDCNECIEAYSPLLDSRDWKAIKHCVYNIIAKNNKLKL